MGMNDVDAYTAVFLVIVAAITVNLLYDRVMDSIICNVMQARHDAAIAEAKLDAIESCESEVCDLTELPFMHSVPRSMTFWPAVDEYEFQAQLILGEASALRFQLIW